VLTVSDKRRLIRCPAPRPTYPSGHPWPARIEELTWAVTAGVSHDCDRRFLVSEHATLEAAQAARLRRSGPYHDAQAQSWVCSTYYPPGSVYEDGTPMPPRVARRQRLGSALGRRLGGRLGTGD
jgi:hypothetical protein